LGISEYLLCLDSSGSEAHNQLQQKLTEISSLTNELAETKQKVASLTKVPFVPGLWIRIQIGSGFNDFVDPESGFGSGSMCEKN
jgi:hypothetical protein